MKRGVSGCATTAVLMFVSLGCEITAAGEASENDARGFYVGVAASRVEQDAQGEGQMLVGVGPPFGFVVQLRPDQVDADDTPAGWSVTLGYRVNEYLAAELAYYDFGEAHVEERYFPDIAPLPPQINVRSNIEAYGPGLSLLGSLPLTPSLSIFARGGVLFFDQEIERRSGTLRINHRTGDEVWMAGAGAQWSFAPRWAVRVEYQLTDDIEVGRSLPTGQAGTSKIEQATLGVLLEF